MEDSFKSMQEEAVRRVMEMQRRAQSYTQASQPSAPPEPPVQKPSEPSVSAELPDPLKELIGLELDEEKALIGLLIYILYKNGADIKLLLGLGYLLF